MEIFVLIPAYNEEGFIKKCISDTISCGYSNIIVVDDGSTDDTFRIARSMPVIIARHAINLGKGMAVKTGIAIAKKFRADVLIVMDADGQHNPKEISKMAAIISRGDYDVVLGTRTFKPGLMPWSKIIENYIGNVLTYLAMGQYVNDSQCGFRAFSKKSLSLIESGSIGYEYESEIIGQIKMRKLMFFELPVETIYTPYSMGKRTKQNLMNGLQTIYKLIKL